MHSAARICFVFVLCFQYGGWRVLPLILVCNIIMISSATMFVVVAEYLLLVCWFVGLIDVCLFQVAS
jgi:hypothetical protein